MSTREDKKFRPVSIKFARDYEKKGRVFDFVITQLLLPRRMQKSLIMNMTKGAPQESQRRKNLSNSNFFIPRYLLRNRVFKTSPGCSNFEYARPSMLEKTSMLESAREKSSCSSATRVLVAFSLHLRRLFSQTHSLAHYLFSHSQACKCGRRRQGRRKCMQMRGRRGQRGAQMYANVCL